KPPPKFDRQNPITELTFIRPQTNDPIGNAARQFAAGPAIGASGSRAFCGPDRAAASAAIRARRVGRPACLGDGAADGWKRQSDPFVHDFINPPARHADSDMLPHAANVWLARNKRWTVCGKSS